MGKAAKKATEVPSVIADVEVKVNLDVDPNDPRKVKPADKLPSLDDK